MVYIDSGHVEGAESEAETAGAKLVPCPDGEIQPGGVNAHTHIYSGLAPFGMPPPEPPPENFVQILERVWWRLDRALDEDTLRASARYYVAESLLAGTTTLIDHHESPEFIEGSLDVLADACDELGMRAALCFGATERNGGREEGRRGLAECRRFLEENRRPLVTGLVSLHASFTVGDETAREAGQLCAEFGAPMHVHVAEDVADVEDARQRGYAGPMERLFELGALPRGSLMAHGVHLDAAQVRAAEERGLWLMQNPRSNKGNNVGYPPALAESARVAMGTDGYPSRLDEEAAALRLEAAAHGEPAEAVERRVGAGQALAAEVFGVDFASLAAGGAADAVVRRDGQVVHVVVGGRLVVENGELLGADLASIRAEAQAAAPRLWERMAAY
jgi:cytosine/adenosine deaminase-related metal-dependent hydrolase